jgi:Na+/H+-translocating membrane pyrophosphatase
MQNPTAVLLFVVFGVILLGMYVAIRRRLGHPVLIAGLGVLSSITVMTFNGLAQGNTIYQAIFVGLLVGGLFSGGTVIIAWYFATSEQQRGG